MKYTVQQGDCISSIAYDHGFYWQTLWNLPDNADLKKLRKNPNVLLTGDIVTIPDLTIKQQSCADGAKYTFMRKGVPEKLHITLLDSDHQPRPNLDYIITIDGDARRGKTDANGVLTESIPPSAKKGKLTFAAPPHKDKKGNPIPPHPKNQVMLLQLGHLNPISEVSGAKARLANLGFYKGPINDKLDAQTKQAIRDFQTKQGLPVNGTIDAATQQKLQTVHGH